MTVYLVGAGPGDPGLLTRRGAALLGQADVVVYDRLVDPTLLLLARDGAELVDVGKEPAAPGDRPPGGGAGARQAEINELLVRHGRAGRTVVRLKGGDPFVFGRGGEEAAALAEAGVAWQVVPGVSSAFAVPATAGVPVTHRGVSTSVTVVTGHVGEPTSPGGVDWDALGRAGGTLVVLMGMATRAEIAARLLASGRPPGTPVAVVSWGTTPRQRAVRATLGDLASVALDSPAVVVVGDVAGIDLAGRAAAPLEGRSVVVTRARHQAGGLAAALEAAGAHVMALPVIDIADPEDGAAALDRAIGALPGYAWVVFTSANAVHRTMERVPDSRALGPVRLAAVGKATAGALADYHLVPDLVPDRTDAAGLAAAFPLAAVSGARVLFPAAAGARPTLAEGVRSKGWIVDQVEAYRTVPVPPPSPAALPALAAADAVTFASPSAVDAYLAMRVDGRPIPLPPVVACFGPVTASAARAAGLAVTVEAATPGPDALVQSLVEALGRRPSP